MISLNDVFPTGRITRTHGYKGEVAMEVEDDSFDRCEADCLMVDCDGLLVPFFIEEYRFRSNTTVLMKFLDVDSEAQARRLEGAKVYMERSKVHDTDSELSFSQLIGCRIENHDGTPVGTITAVDDSTMNLLFDVEAPDGRSLLIPASDELVEDIDIAHRRIVMNVPEGLLEL